MTTTLTNTLQDVLRAEGPLDIRGLKNALARRGFELDDSACIRLVILEAGALSGTVGEDENLFVATDVLFAGRTFTHRLTAFDIKMDCLPIWPDFAHLYPMFTTAPYDRIDDYVLGRAFHPERQFSDLALLRPGAFERCRPGDLVGVRFQAGRLELVEVDKAGPMPLPAQLDLVELVDPADPMRPYYEDEDEDGYLDFGPQPREIAHVIRHLCFTHPTLFNVPLLPVGELFDALDLEVRGELVGVPGLTDWFVCE